MGVYAGDFAELYDFFYAEKPYEEEAGFVDRLLREHANGPSRRLLDVACGTGQHAVRLAERGWSVVGVDQSDDMLQRARERAGDRDVTFVQQDMRELDLGQEFDATVSLFDSIGYGVTNEAILSTLRGVRRHLRDDGLFLAEFWHAAPMLREHEPLRIREWDTPDGRILRISRTSLDVTLQVARVEYTVYRIDPNTGRSRFRTEQHENRYFLMQEMALFLDSTGFQPIQWLAGFDADRFVDDSSWHLLVLARAIGHVNP